MKQLRYIMVAIVAVFALSACSSLHTAFDYDKDANFTQYKTFAFYKEGMDLLKVNDVDKKRFVKYISEDLQSKGLKMNTETPDLLVNVIIKGKGKTSVSDNYPYGYGWWYPLPSVTVRQYTETTIYIDLIDKAKNQLVWQGKGVGEFSEIEKDKDAKIEETIVKILAQYPYGKKK